MIHRTLDIWENLSYAHAGTEPFRPVLETYILDLEHRKTSAEGMLPRPAVLILPGGGYGMTSPREAEPIALRFLAAGFHAMVLYYSVAPNRHPQPLRDVSRAMNIIRDNADAWHLDAERIAVCGFSAGGHLAASLGVHWNREFLDGVPGLEPGRNRPDALILAYPVITSGEKAHRGSFVNLLGENPSAEALNLMSLENQVGPQVPPAFLWHTVEDASVPVENSLLFASALRRNGIPFEMHLYPRGGHGLALSNAETANSAEQIVPATQNWIDMAAVWLNGC